MDPVKQALKLLVLRSIEPSQGPQSIQSRGEAGPAVCRLLCLLWLGLLFDPHDVVATQWVPDYLMGLAALQGSERPCLKLRTIPGRPKPPGTGLDLLTG